MSLEEELGHLKIPFETIKSATNNFSNENIIGEGGFGSVYKGQLPPSASDHRSTVAVKRLDVKRGQGEKEFLMELAMLSSYKHENLVSLVGFCNEKDEKILVFEHEFRGSLDKYLNSRDLSWLHRLQICIGAARGLNYLHSGVGAEHRVLHRDVKSSNILLDENWEAKISDFGLSKIGPSNHQFSFLVTNACGTFGYVDPLYVKTGILTKESDVYSFGVVLFEVLCGRLALIVNYHDERRCLAQLAVNRYEDEKLDEIIDPNLRKQMKGNSLRKFSAIAYQCLKENRKHRPTMGVIVEELQNALENQLGCRKLTRIGMWGSSTGGSSWSFQIESNHKLKMITIDHKDWLFSIRFTTKDLNGELFSSEKFGGTGGPSGGQVSEISFSADEKIIGINGTVGRTTGRYANYIVISSLSFVTNINTKGPFGEVNGTGFSIPWDIGSFGGFYGRAGFYLDGLGVFLKATI